MRIPTVSAVLGIIATVSVAQAQDIEQGRQLALEVCATCHAVLPDEVLSPVATAPSFEVVAMTPGMTAAALNVWLTAQSHPTMPNILLSQQEVGDVSAYILSLQTNLSGPDTP
jgi:mono/diheme cytochrome c family protein